MSVIGFILPFGETVGAEEGSGLTLEFAKDTCVDYSRVPRTHSASADLVIAGGSVH